jgi:hypothetical protein
MKFNSSLFSQILQIVPRSQFMKLVVETGSERHSKGFSCWDQYVAMLFCQLAQAKSLREICDGLAVTCGKLFHLGMKSSPPKSTLAYANAHRSFELYEKLFYHILERCHEVTPAKKSKFRFKNKLLSMDATTIDLCLSMFPWAEFRRTKGAVKLHMLLDHEGYMPVFAAVTGGLCGEVNVARAIAFPKGSIVVFDRGYCDYSLFDQWTRQQVYFVTRLKAKAAFAVIQDRVTPQRSNIRSDQLIRFTGPNVSKHCQSVFRRIVAWDERNQKEIVFLTNHLAFGATTIGAIYRDRWEIELFFKVLKQHLKIKTFIGTSPNALKVQIWTALIAVLLIKYMQFKSKCVLPLCRLVALLRLNLFTYRDLWAWLADPFETPPEEPPLQLGLAI